MKENCVDSRDHSKGLSAFFEHFSVKTRYSVRDGPATIAGTLLAHIAH